VCSIIFSGDRKKERMDGYSNGQPSSDLQGDNDTSLGKMLGTSEISPPQEKSDPRMLWSMNEAGELLLQSLHKVSIQASVLLACLPLLCHIKKQHVLLVSTGFP
jgi:hypothetical protein